MATEKELLTAIEVIRNHCKDHCETTDENGSYLSCKSCLLRNRSVKCGLFESQSGVDIDSPEEWATKKLELPKLFVY